MQEHIRIENKELIFNPLSFGDLRQFKNTGGFYDPALIPDAELHYLRLCWAVRPAQAENLFHINFAMSDPLNPLQTQIGHSFKDAELLLRALTHPSPMSPRR